MHCITDAQMLYLVTVHHIAAVSTAPVQLLTKLLHHPVAAPTADPPPASLTLPPGPPVTRPWGMWEGG